MSMTALPDNRTALEVALEQTLQQMTGQRRDLFPDLWRPNDCPVEWLPWLAEAMGVRDWDAQATEQEQRVLLLNVWPQYRQGGLRVAYKRAVVSLGFDVSVVPWYDGGDMNAPYTAQVICWAVDQSLTSEMLQRLQIRLRQARSERDLVSVVVGRQAVGSVSYGASVSVGKVIQVESYFSSGAVVQAAPLVGVAAQFVKTISIQAGSV